MVVSVPISATGSAVNVKSQVEVHLPVHFSALFSFLRVFEKSKAERSQSWRQIPSWAKITTPTEIHDNGGQYTGSQSISGTRREH